MSKNQKDDKVMRELGPYLNLGWQLVISICLMALLGWWLDKHFSTNPVWTIICTLFGVFAGMYSFIRTVINLDKPRKKNEEDVSEDK